MDGVQKEISTQTNQPWKIWGLRSAIILVVMAAVFYCANIGLRYRRWVWDTTAPIRFTADIDRGFYWGRQAATEGYVNQYLKMQPEQPDDENWLDYGPLRLGVMTMWAQWAAIHYPQVKVWHDDRSYALTEPVLRFNLLMEAVGIISAFFLTRFWARQRTVAPLGSSTRDFFCGTIPGLAAAALLWFNPAIVISAYGWPTWDLWIIPMFLLAALLASYEWWFTAGVVIGIGAMFKGQQLLSIPVFVAWALIIGRPVFAVRVLSGTLIAIALVASPWLLTYIPADKLAAAREIQSHGQAAMVPDGTFAIPRLLDVPAVIWIAGVLIATVAMPFVVRQKPKALEVDATNPTVPFWRHLLASHWTWRAALALVTMLMVIWPWFLHRNRSQWLEGMAAAIALSVVVQLIRPRAISCTAAVVTGIALLLCMSVFQGSSAWYDCGIHFGTIHWPHMAIGADNLPGILASDYDWNGDDLKAIAITLPAHTIWSLWGDDVEVSISALLRAIFFITLTASAIGIGMHARRKDPRILIALTTPWLMLFCFPPQVHERYLLFAAGISCICCGISTGMTLLGVLLTIVTALMTLNTMLSSAGPQYRRVLGESLARQFPAIFDEHGGATLFKITNGIHPDVGFAVVLIGLIFLYFTLAPRRRIV